MAAFGQTPLARQISNMAAGINQQLAGSSDTRRKQSMMESLIKGSGAPADEATALSRILAPEPQPIQDLQMMNPVSMPDPSPPVPQEVSGGLDSRIQDFKDSYHFWTVEERAAMFKALGEAGMTTEQQSGLRSFVNQFKDTYTEQKINEVIPKEPAPVTEKRDVITEGLIKAAEKSPGEDGTPYIDLLSALDSGKKRIYEMYKADNPKFRFMNKQAVSAHDRLEKQFRYQYDIESFNPESEFFFGDRTEGQDADTSNVNYRSYLDRAELWNRDDWRRNLDAAFKELKNPTRSLVSIGEEGEKITPSSMLSNIALVSQDPDAVTEWIVTKSLKGTNPIVRRYGPEAIRNDVRKWMANNINVRGLGETPTPGSKHASLFENEVTAAGAKSLLEEFARRDWNWYGKKGFQ